MIVNSVEFEPAGRAASSIGDTIIGVVRDVVDDDTSATTGVDEDTTSTYDFEIKVEAASLADKAENFVEEGFDTAPLVDEASSLFDESFV